MSPRAKAINYVLSVLITSAVLGAIFSIDPAKEYSWFAGLFHGAWVPGNWLLSLFMDDHLVKAPVHTTAYNIFWWIWCVFICISIFFNCITIIFAKGQNK